ncbi:MAG TPA: 2-dehydropantoate 2-reductase N-terminal domain-containing protein [Acidimicrobiales bacterium]|nr:2-dehydropantoate 2-reductase N-terminal domain-containing protein [Acidimicrobiales bacterium]
MKRRFVIFGAGAIGGTIGGRLFEHGHDVALIARGPHGDACRTRGLTLRTADVEVTLPVPTVGTPEELEDVDPERDVVILATKTQDTAEALDALASVAPATTPIVCAQNGVANERMALRRFEHVHGMCVMLPATHLEPGVVEVSSTPISGILDVGRYPLGMDQTTEVVAAALSSSSCSSEAVPDIMRRKYAKLLMNLGNALDAACGAGARRSPLFARAREEAMACFAAADIDFASEEEDRARRGELLQVKPIDGKPRGGGSTWQSLARGTGRTEVDYLNGEIVLLGRLYGIATPVNERFRQVANELARSGAAPGSVDVAELEAEC